MCDRMISVLNTITIPGCTVQLLDVSLPDEAKLMGLSNILVKPGLKVGQMTQIIWVTFLGGQVGLIHNLSYLDVTWIFNRSLVLYKKTLASDK